MVRQSEAKADLCGFEGARKGKRSGRETQAKAKREQSRREGKSGSGTTRDLDNPIFPVTIA